MPDYDDVEYIIGSVIVGSTGHVRIDKRYLDSEGKIMVVRTVKEWAVDEERPFKEVSNIATGYRQCLVDLREGGVIF